MDKDIFCEGCAFVRGHGNIGTQGTNIDDATCVHPKAMWKKTAFKKYPPSISNQNAMFNCKLRVSK